MTVDPASNLSLAERYLSAIERGATGDELAAFFAEDVVQVEFPNQLNPTGAERDLQAILDAAERGQHIVQNQRYDVVNRLTSGDAVVFEVQWSATLAVETGTLPVGGQMRARFAVFLEFRNGKIVRQRNYDCFEPW